MNLFETTPPPLASVQRPLIDTNQAAYYLGRSPQTLRIWACKGTGPITPRRIGGRLGWPVDKIRELVG